ncbi:MAG: hypothetical protein K2X29_10420 [Candidatus Obscuribacterales bacterium]|nr:hypothetical protein [Candidatus Obscuribacterales bacterium]
MKNYRFGFVVFIVAVIIACFATASVRADDDDDYELLYTTPDKWLQVWSDHAIDQSRCKMITDRVRKAYSFVAKEEGWSNPELLYKNPLKVRLVQGFKSNILGFARGPNLFVVRDEYMDDPLSEGTLAHELTHIQDARQLKGSKEPSFFAEGRALTNGHNYRIALGQDQNQYDMNMAKSAMRFTSEDASERLYLPHDEGWDMEAIGTFFVEYLRTRWNGGIANIHPRTAKVVENIASGLEFKAAFEKEFATPFESAVKAFMGYLDRTVETPQVRLEKTMWQDIGPAKGPASGMDDDDED